MNRFTKFSDRWREFTLVCGSLLVGSLLKASSSAAEHIVLSLVFAFFALLARFSAFERRKFEDLVDQAAAPRDNTGLGYFSMVVWVREARERLGWNASAERNEDDIPRAGMVQ